MLKPNNTQTFMKVYERELRELEARKIKLTNLIKSMKELTPGKGGKNKKDDKTTTRKGRPLLPKVKGAEQSQSVNMTTAIKEFLFESKKEHPIGDILEAVLAKGASIQSQNPKNVISTTLYRLKKTGMVVQNKNGWKLKGK